MTNYSKLRSIFAYGFPLLLAALFVIVFVFFNQYQQELAQLEELETWLDRAKVIISSIRSSYQIEDRLEQQLRPLFSKKAYWLTATSKGEALAAFIKSLPETEYLSKAKIWAFSGPISDIKPLQGDSLQSSMLRIMQRSFVALHHLSSDSESAVQLGNSAEVFLNRVFGDYSIPKQLATSRKGLPTPVRFTDKPYYLYWNYIETAPDVVTGMILLLPSPYAENAMSGLKLSANKATTATNNQILVAFINSHPINQQENSIILPGQLDGFPQQAAQLKKQLQQINAKPDYYPTRQVFTIGEHRFFKDFIDLNTSYTVVLIAETPQAAQLVSPRFITALMGLIYFGLCFCILRPGNFRQLPISAIFRLLFFMTGLLPITLLGIIGITVIEQSAALQIESEADKAIDAMEAVSEKFEHLSLVARSVIRKTITNEKLPPLFLSPQTAENKKAYEVLTNTLAKQKFFVDYLMIFKPEKEPIWFASDQVNSQTIEHHLDYCLISAQTMNLHLYKSDVTQSNAPNHPHLKLNSRQNETLLRLNATSRYSIRNTIQDSFEQPVYVQMGGESSHYIFSSLLIDGAEIGGYVICGINMEKSIREFVNDEFSALNSNPLSPFLALSTAKGSPTILPDDLGENSLKSARTTQLLRFLESVSSSFFAMRIRYPDHVEVLNPLTRIPQFYAGASINIVQINRLTAFRYAVLYSFLAVLAAITYLLSASISFVMLEPVKQLEGVFAQIAAGNMKVSFNYPYKNELGQLAIATSNMIKGLSERKLLGKFVSSTFDSGIIKQQHQSTAQTIVGSVLFCDIRNFTTISESQTPVDLAKALNLHLKAMVEVIHRHDGKVEQFIGDAIVALFPENESSEALSALRAASAMTSIHDKLQHKRTQAGNFNYDIGIGIDRGEIIAGILHTGKRSEFSVIGVARTRAEELEALSKTGSHTKIVVSDAYQKACQLPEINFVRLAADQAWELKEVLKAQ